jgi:hypothetical protein
VRDRPAGGGQQPHLVGLALDPRLLQPHGRRVQPPDRPVSAAELHERVVDERLRDRHLVGPVVAHRQLDHARLEHGPLDRELLRGRATAVAETGSAEHREQADEGGDQRQRDEPQQPCGRLRYA